jgi:alkaline phosphatase D
MPIRDQADGRIFRALKFGDLIDLVLIDTRLWGRDRPSELGTDVDVIRDPARTLLGFDQEEWLAEQVRTSAAQWFLLGQQVVMTQWKLQGLPESQGGGPIGNIDAWDGYHATRVRFFEAVRAAQLRNLVVLTGDVHSSWASDLTEDPNEPSHYDPETGRGSLGVELVTPAVTSVFPAPGAEALFVSQNPAIKYGETRHRGYLVVDIDRLRAQGLWYHLDDVTEPETLERLVAVFTTRDGQNHLESGA